jgi:tetratricopeptide (TPR) repeat protein
VSATPMLRAEPVEPPPLGRFAEFVRELTRRRGDLVEHGRGSLKQHLEGVHAMLARWEQPERVRLAGLAHSVYSTESFRVALFGRDERSRLRELVGAEAERLAFAFGGCPRYVLVAAARHDGGATQVATRWPGVVVGLDRRDLAELLVLHAANLAEQVCRGSGSPARWLAVAGELLALARGELEVVPPVFARCTRALTPDEERALGRAYRAALRGAMPGALETPDVPVGEPLVVAGLHALAERRAPAAAALGARALGLFDAWGTAWDKRLGLSRWRQLARLLVRDGAARDAELVAAGARARGALQAARGAPQRTWARLDALEVLDAAPVSGGDAASPSVASVPASRTPLVVATPRAPAPPTALPALPARFAAYLAGLRDDTEHPLLHFYPGLDARPWHDPGRFPIVADLQRLAPQIAEEARAFDAASFQDEVENIGRTGRWSVLFLLEMGRRNEEHLARCPSLRWILDHHRMVTSYAGSMYFSSLAPRSRVEAHLGPTNLRLRCHLALEVPDGCGIRVGGLTSSWKEGACVVFDDSFAHEVWNDGDRRRLVLVLDLWHPDLGDDEVALLAGLHRYGAAHAARAARYWARNDAERTRADAGRAKADPVEASRQAVAESPADARAHLLLGHELTRAERHAEAEVAFRAALAVDPSLAMAHNNLGWALEMQGDTAGAVEAYERALALDRSCGRARRNLASLMTTLGRYREALELRQEELRADPDSANALGAVVGAATRAGELHLASELGVRHNGICRGTRWYPVRRPAAPPLPASVAWERVLTPSKLLHDIEQLEYLRGCGILRDELSPVVAAYDDALATLGPLGPDARVPLRAAAGAILDDVYNRIVHVRPTPRVARALSGAWDAAAVEAAYLARRPNAVVVDDFLSDEAIRSLRAFCLESTVWSENRYNHGRLGSMFQDGFNCPLLVQIAEELRAALPRVIRLDLPARQIWGYKYANRAPQETPHADFAVVNVNFWITPHEANLDPSTGGLLLYDVAAPAHWDFKTYNSNAGREIRELLAERRAVPTHIPYRYNRAVVFDSDLIHGTPAIHFRGGYENRRMNVTVLYGSREER